MLPDTEATAALAQLALNDRETAHSDVNKKVCSQNWTATRNHRKHQQTTRKNGRSKVRNAVRRVASATEYAAVTYFFA